MASDVVDPARDANGKVPANDLLTVSRGNFRQCRNNSAAGPLASRRVIEMKKEPAVLLVEDEPLLGELMTEALIDQGFEVHAAPDANNALRHLLSGAEVD